MLNSYIATFEPTHTRVTNSHRTIEPSLLALYPELNPSTYQHPSCNNHAVPMEYIRPPGQPKSCTSIPFALRTSTPGHIRRIRLPNAFAHPHYHQNSRPHTILPLQQTSPYCHAQQHPIASRDDSLPQIIHLRRPNQNQRPRNGIDQLSCAQTLDFQANLALRP
jgi:hypothetical protein